MESVKAISIATERDILDITLSHKLSKNTVTIITWNIIIGTMIIDIALINKLFGKYFLIILIINP